MSNKNPSELQFEVSEFKQRVQKVKQKMVAKGIEVLIATDPANMSYLTGYDGWSFYVHQCVIIVLDDEQPIWVGRGQDANGAQLTTWIDQNHIIPYTDDYVQSTLKHPMDFVSNVLKTNGQ